MAAYTISTGLPAPDTEVLSLYESVGWTAYTNGPDLLYRAIRNSSFVAVARTQHGRLIGLARTVSDDATICYVQDILVHPAFQGTGAGRALFTQVEERYRHVRQMVLITDDEPQQRAFYQSMGLTEGSDFESGPVRVFARFR
jgi:GNAT superfamily N-acetyltransferase